jgi:hypothetical protein
MIGHELTALHGIDHARTLAVVLPSLLDVRRSAKGEKLLQYGERVWGSPRDPGRRGSTRRSRGRADSTSRSACARAFRLQTSARRSRRRGRGPPQDRAGWCSSACTSSAERGAGLLGHARVSPSGSSGRPPSAGASGRARADTHSPFLTEKVTVDPARDLARDQRAGEARLDLALEVALEGPAPKTGS